MTKKLIEKETSFLDELNLSLQEPITSRKVNISSCRYADDLLTVAQVTTPVSVVRKIKAWDRAWSEFCVPNLLGQNAGKRQLLVLFVGPGAPQSHAELRELCHVHGLTTQLTEVAKHLGSLHQFTGSNGPELDARIARAQANWCTLGRFWHVPAVALTVRLMMFHAL
eukprot:2814432-Heterocapsa_arctica.AAC.1